MKKIMVFGAFDGLHVGHLNFFKQARKYGDYLIVSVGTDKNVAKIKGKRPLFAQNERLALVKQCRLVDLAILGAEKDFFTQIKKLAPDVICLGYDQWATKQFVRRELDKVGLKKTKVARLAPYKAHLAKSRLMKHKSVEFIN